MDVHFIYNWQWFKRDENIWQYTHMEIEHLEEVIHNLVIQILLYSDERLESVYI